MYKWDDYIDEQVMSACDGLQLNIYVYDARGDHSSTSAFWMLGSINEDSHSEIVRTKLDPSIRSTKTFSSISRWINKCCSEHVECQLSSDEKVLPTRLVSVQPTGNASDIVANICHTDKLPTETPYLTLSHCWGGVKFLTTTRNNLNSFESSLPVGSLSRTFQDALFATVNLGFQYIWIDSLCIVQDDAEDWKRESRLMHEVYRYATCNVSASGFPDPLQGFVLDQRCISSDPVPVTLVDKVAQQRHSPSQHASGKAYHLIHEDPWQEMRRGPIFLRAWTLQEQLLATRTIHFGNDQAYWECKCTVANEVWPLGWLNTPLESLFRERTDSSWKFKLDDVPSTNNSLYNSWFDVIEDYSRRHITFATDRLPALAGITKEFVHYLGDDSEYGLWNRDLHRGILFQQVEDRDAPQQPLSMPTWENAPSWSWVACGKSAVWSYGVRNIKADHICDVELLRITNTAPLRLRGALIPCPSDYRVLEIVSSKESLGCRVQGSNEHGFVLEFCPDPWFETYLREHEANIVPVSSWGEWVTEDKQIKAFLDSILIMPILCYKETIKEENYTQCGTIMCLLLNLLPGPDRGVYRRVGIVEVSIPGGDEMDVQTLRQQFEAYGKPLDSHLFQDEDCHGNYVVTVL
ncbi:hypothetical protein ACET3X_007200 [Alternaria dauci]|uniref:Heterokaryon incompatibility domain-containing protein n=1 Tax=Alternaria dauci TaxID=48095 RepID=A0ABR3UGC3_9PLEO